MVHGGVAVVAERHVAESQGSGRSHRIASQTTAQRQALTASAALSRAMRVMRRIDHGAACAGCGDAGPWLWACICPCSWLAPWGGEVGPIMEQCYIIT